MKIYECVPQKNFKKISGIVALLICAALILFFVTSVFAQMPYRWVLQLIGFGCLSAVIYITVKYITKTYLYAVIKKDNGELDFTVTEISNGGKKSLTVCRISIKNIEQTCTLDKRNDTDKIKIDRILVKAKEEKREVFSYAQDIAPAELCYILVTECDQALILKLAPDKTLQKYLSGQLDTGAEE